MLRTAAVRVVLAVSLAGAALPAARANLLTGQTVEATYCFPNICTVFAGPQDVIGPAGTISNFANFVNLAFSDTNILITTTRNAGLNNVAFDGLRFVDLNANIPHFTNVTLDPATNYAGFTSSRISTAANTIFVNLEDLPGLTGQQISLDIVSTTVPEPNSIAILGAALASVLLWSRKAAR